MTELSCVILDWSGTTVDFGALSPVLAFRKAFAGRGLSPELTDSELRAPAGMLSREHLGTMFSMVSLRQHCQQVWGRAPEAADVDEIYDLFRMALLAVLRSCSVLKPHTLSVVQSLRKQGIKIGSTTGYSRSMMQVVASCAAAQGYSPDCIVTPDEVGWCDRPAPYMIFENMRRLHIPSVKQCMKVGDTFADIAEGKNAGVFSVAVTEGSSVMGLSAEEFADLTPAQREERHQQATDTFLSYGADFVIRNLSELPRAQAAFNALYA